MWDWGQTISLFSIAAGIIAGAACAASVVCGVAVGAAVGAATSIATYATTTKAHKYTLGGFLGAGLTGAVFGAITSVAGGAIKILNKAAPLLKGAKVSDIKGTYLSTRLAGRIWVGKVLKRGPTEHEGGTLLIGAQKSFRFNQTFQDGRVKMNLGILGQRPSLHVHIVRY